MVKTACSAGDLGLIPGLGRFPEEGKGYPLWYSGLEKSMDAKNPWGRKQWDTTERLHFHFSLSCIEEGNGNPLQCSCLENPRDGGAWWAAIYGVAQSQTPLKRLSSSSSSLLPGLLFFRASGEIGLSPDLHGLLFFNALLHYYILKGPL